MTDNPLVQERQRNKRELQDILKKNPETPLRQLLAAFSCKTGLSVKAIERYYRELVDAGLVKEREGA